MPMPLMLLRSVPRPLLVPLLCLSVSVCALPSVASAQLSGGNRDGASMAPDGPVQIRQGSGNGTGQGGATTRRGPAPVFFDDSPREALVIVPRDPDEFERFVSGLAGFTAKGQPAQIRRFGSDLQPLRAGDAAEGEPLPLVPSDYVVKPGDEVVVALWGSVDADLTLRVDRSGRLTIPRIGTMLVAGTRFSDLTDVVRRRVAQTFRNFELSVSLGQLRGVRVFVTGFVTNPGSYNVTSLSTISQALLKAGGPAPAGSFRQITLRRQGQPALAFDLYDLLVKGERRNDTVLQPDDVVHVGAVGTQVAMIGSVNQQAIFEMRPGETVRELVQYAGGLSPVADSRRLTLERLEERDKLRVVELLLPESETRTLAQGDVLRAISAVAAAGSQLVQNKRVRVEGEVARPGTYVLPPGSSLDDALKIAGGLSKVAYIFGTELQRESVRINQQENYDRALRDVETEFARAGAVQRISTAEESAAQANRTASTARLIDRLRAVRPSGRVVLEVKPETNTLPPLALEDGDRLLVPARATTVGVFGSVFSTGNYLYGEQRTLGDYLRLAGGPTRAADRDSIFVIRANGSVVSESQSSGWFTSDKLSGTPALPGDTVFVPEEINRTTFIQNVKDWTQILFQLGLGVAAFKSLN